MKDLIVLTADADMSATMEQILSKRQRSLGIRLIEFTVSRHLRRDAGCRVGAAERLRGHCLNHHFALVMFDKHGCGRETESRETIQNEVEQELYQNGWADRSKVIVIDRRRGFGTIRHTRREYSGGMRDTPSLGIGCEAGAFGLPMTLNRPTPRRRSNAP